MLKIIFQVTIIIISSITIISAQTGTLKWKYNVGDEIHSSPALDKNGNIYFGAMDNYLYSLDIKGNLRWKFRTKNIITSSPSIGNDGTIYFGSKDKHIYALNPDGIQKWSHTVSSDWVVGAIAISKAGDLFFGSGPYLYAMKKDGTLKWTFRTDYEIWGSPAIDKQGNIYFGSLDSYLYSLKPDGSLNWKFRTKGLIVSSPAIGDDGVIYFGSQDKYFYVLNRDGTLKHKFEAIDNIRSSAVIDKDGTIYFGSDYYFYALSRNVTLKWKRDIITISSAVIDKNGTIYVGGNSFYSLHPDGTNKWTYRTDHEIISSPTIAEDGTIYMTCRDGYLYAFTGTAPLADSPWPKFQKNVFNTGSDNEYTIDDVLERINLINSKISELVNYEIDTKIINDKLKKVNESKSRNNFDNAMAILDSLITKADLLFSINEKIKHMDIKLEQLKREKMNVDYLKKLIDTIIEQFRSGNAIEAEKAVQEAEKAADQIFKLRDPINSTQKEIAAAKSIKAKTRPAEEKLEEAFRQMAKGEFDSVRTLSQQAGEIAATANVGRINIGDLIAFADRFNRRTVEAEGIIDNIKADFGKGYTFEIDDGTGKVNCRYDKSLKKIRNGHKVYVKGKFIHKEQVIELDQINKSSGNLALILIIILVIVIVAALIFKNKLIILISSFSLKKESIVKTDSKGDGK